LGIPLSTLLAGAGVGGVAVALAAQDALKNVIAGMLITLDKPFRLGDRIIIKGRDGVVEGVGLRSVRLRTGSGHLITIPNSHVSSGDVENTSVRPHIQRVTDIALPLDLSRAKVEQAVRIVKGILQDHPGLDPKLPPRVFVPDLNRDSLTLRLICWYHPPDYWDYVAFCDETNLAIIEAFERAEIPFAPPTQRTFFDAFPGSPIGLKVDTKLSSNRGSEGSGALKEPRESDGRSA
jgi:MscS family membrane protein